MKDWGTSIHASFLFKTNSVKCNLKLWVGELDYISRKIPPRKAMGTFSFRCGVFTLACLQKVLWTPLIESQHPYRARLWCECSKRPVRIGVMRGLKEEAKSWKAHPYSHAFVPRERDSLSFGIPVKCAETNRTRALWCRKIHCLRCSNCISEPFNIFQVYLPDEYEFSI